MMKVLLVYTNRYRVMAPPPIGLAYLAGPLREEGHEVKVVDLMFSKAPDKELRSAIDDFRPDVVGFSVRNIDNQDMRRTRFFPEEARKYVDIAREKGVVTVLGGTAFTTFPSEMLAYMGADYGIAGQGERSLPRLLRALGSGIPDKEIPGLAWRENGAVLVNPPDLNGYCAAIARWEALGLGGYKKGFFVGAVINKTGCPHRCAYCNVAATFGGRFILRKAEDIVREIRALKNTHGINIFTLTDACFNMPLDYAKEVLAAIAGADVRIYLNATLVPVMGQYDDELLELYKKAGGICLSLGAETYSAEMLASYRKPFTIDDVLACAGLLDRHKMPFMVQALFGGPGENASTIKESMDMLRRIPYARFTYAIGVRLLPGTALYETAKGEGRVKEPSELFSPTFYVSKDLDVAWADKYIKKRLLRYSYRNLKMLPVIARCALARTGRMR